MKRIALFVVTALALNTGSVSAQDSLGVRCVGKLTLEAWWIGEVEIEGDYAYLGTNYGIAIADISDPTDPRLIANWYSESNAYEIVIAGTIAYVANDFQGLSILDVSDPQAPSKIGEFRPCQVWAVAIHGQVAYVPTAPARLYLLNVNDPSNPGCIGSCNISADCTWGVVVHGEAAYVETYYPFGIAIVDIGNPEAPAQIGVMDSIAFVAKLVGIDDRLYIIGGGGLRIASISDQFQPEVIGFYPSFISPVNLFVVNNFAFISGRGLSIIDVSDPINMKEIGYYRFQNDAIAVEVVGNYAYMAIDSSLYIYDCSEAMGVQPAGTPAPPSRVTLSPAFPNPFNSRATVGFTLPRPGVVNFGLFDPMGRQVRRLESSGWFLAGSHQIAFNADGLPSGGYFIQIQTGENVLQQRVTLVR